MSDDTQKLPGIKRERVGESKVREFEQEVDGKTAPMKEETFTEKEIDSVHLVKIAPMFYFCTDNNKVLMIPFSVQFSPTEILKLAAGLAHNLEKMLKPDGDKTPDKVNFMEPNQ